jgi:[acyl-carrier-protein] S-malonyltransferase
MFKRLYEQHAVVRHTFTEAGDALGCDMGALCFEGSMDATVRLALAHVATITCSVAAFRLYMHEIGLAPAITAGHSVGEFAALVAAGVIRFDDALRAVWVRAKLQEEAAQMTDAVLLAIKHLPPGQVQQVCYQTGDQDAFAHIACYNGPDQVVITVHRRIVEQISGLVAAQGGQVVDLNVNVPFHCSLLQSAAHRLREHLEGLHYSPPEWPVLANVTARPHASQPGELIEALTVQLTRPVRWHESIVYMQSQGIAHAIELGPGMVLKRLNQRIARNIRAYAIDQQDDFAAVRELRLTVPGYVATCLAIAVSTKNHNRDAQEYAEQVSASYALLQGIYRQSEQMGRVPTDEERDAALAVLRQILRYKQVARADYEATLSRLARLAPSRAVSTSLLVEQDRRHSELVVEH